MEYEESLLNKELPPQNLNNSNDTVLNNEVSKLGVVVRNFLGQHVNDDQGIDCTLKLFLDRMQQLEAAWSDNEKKFAILQADNKQLQMQLIREQNKCAVFQKRLQFIQENRGHFEKLKEMYSKMKEMEVDKSRSRINIHKATQSESVVTVSSYATCVLQPEVTDTLHLWKTPSTVFIRKVELAKAQDTINILKQLIYRREQTWGHNRDKHQHYVQNVKRLEIENENLRSIVNTHYGFNKERMRTSMNDLSKINVEVNDIKPDECVSNNTVDDSVTVMQAIVKKLENRNRELEKMSKVESSSNIFSKRELAVLNRINSLQNLTEVSSEIFTNKLPTKPSKEPVPSIRKQPAKSASSPVPRTRYRSVPPPTIRLSSCTPAPSAIYPKCYDARYREPSCVPLVLAGPSRSRRTERQARTVTELPLLMNGSREETELEILKQIKCEIMKKQQNINKKLEIFQQGAEKRQQKKLRSKTSSQMTTLSFTRKIKLVGEPGSTEDFK